MKAPTKTGKSSATFTPSRRAWAGRDLGALLPGVTKPAFRKRSPATVTLFLDWKKIVGPSYATRTQPKKLSAGILTVACQGPAAMELQHMQSGMIDRINRWCGPGTVFRLKITQDFQPVKATTSPRRKPVTPIEPVSLPDLPEGPLRDALEALGNRISERKHGQR